MDSNEIRDFIWACREEADEAKQERMNRNKDNYDTFHLHHDFTHKEDGQSMEILSKQPMAVEQTKSFYQQALADLGEWWKCQAKFPGAEEAMKIKPHEITKLTNYMLEKRMYYNHVGNSVQSALLGSLAISKVDVQMKPYPKYVAKKKGRGKKLKKWVERIEDKSAEVGFKLVRQENYYPDPSGAGLYEIEDCWVDFHTLVQMAEQDEDFNMELVKKVSKGGVGDIEETYNKARETGQNTNKSTIRKIVKLTEFWGDILNKDGELVHENVQAIVANDTDLILSPRPNPFWHKRSPYTASPLMEVANSVWHKAPMDAPTQHNRALIEMYNLMVDAGMKQVHANVQIRKDWLDDPAQVSDGIKPGDAIGVNSMCPPGGKVLEPLSDVVIPAEAFNVFNIMSQEFNASALTNDIRSGVFSPRAVKATEVVEASQTITSVSQGMAKNYENRQLVKELELAWMTTAQNWEDINEEVFVTCFGADRGKELYQLDAEEVFASTVNGLKFQVFGITQTIGKAQDFRKLTTLLQTIGSAPILMEEYLKKYDIGLTLGEIMTTLDIDKNKLEIPQEVQNTMAPQSEEGMQEPQPDGMSQVPEAGALSDFLPGGGPQFPGSPDGLGGAQ